jgi:hypothetical protein
LFDVAVNEGDVDAGKTVFRKLGGELIKLKNRGNGFSYIFFN